MRAKCGAMMRARKARHVTVRVTALQHATIRLMPLLFIALLRCRYAAARCHDIARLLILPYFA